MTQPANSNTYSAVTDGRLPISSEMAAMGEGWYNSIWSLSDTGGNGSMFLFGKFPGGAEAEAHAPQLPRVRTPEYRSIMITDEGQFADGTYESQLPSFVFAASMSAELEQAIDTRRHDTNVLLRYPDPQRPGHSVISYKMWCSNELINKVAAPNNFLMDFNFTLPDDSAEQFLHNVATNGDFLESFVRASRLGDLMRPGGEVQRFQNTRLKTLNIPPYDAQGSPNPDASLARRTLMDGPNARMRDLARWLASDDCPTLAVRHFGEVA